MKNDLEKFDNDKILDIINQSDKLSKEDKRELVKKMSSDDLEIRKSTLEKMTQSQLAFHDIQVVLNELATLNKQGMYMKSTQTIKTGSGEVKVEFKGGDRKLIIPVLVIFGIILITLLLIIFQ